MKPKNLQRAQRAARALNHYKEETGDRYADQQTLLIDLLADLLHLADRKAHVNFDDALRTARSHHETERINES